ncbi:MAG: class I SAM-dependent methyltransferase [Candidatus Aenigmarchaeota archaeon]|nr:class I SAM-dependent methyltransferase [Candidatus Aenigmarchaeota archaeon]
MPSLHTLYQKLGEPVLGIVSRFPYPIQRSALRTFSEISRICLQGEGNLESSWRQLEYIYQNNPHNAPWHFLDHTILDMEGCAGARSRLHTVKSRLTSLSKKYAVVNGGVYILDVGTGPGWYINEVVRDIGEECDIHATCIDQNKEAVKYAITQAQKFNIDGRVEFIHSELRDHLSTTKQEYDIALLIGVLDYLPTPLGIRMLRYIRDRLKPGGTLLTSNMKEHNLKWAMDAVGWKLVYKDRDEVRNILEKAGLEDITTETEPEGAFVIAEGKRS